MVAGSCPRCPTSAQLPACLWPREAVEDGRNAWDSPPTRLHGGDREEAPGSWFWLCPFVAVCCGHLKSEPASGQEIFLSVSPSLSLSLSLHIYIYISVFPIKTKWVNGWMNFFFSKQAPTVRCKQRETLAKAPDCCVLFARSNADPSRELGLARGMGPSSLAYSCNRDQLEPLSTPPPPRPPARPPHLHKDR